MTQRSQIQNDPKPTDTQKCRKHWVHFKTDQQYLRHMRSTGGCFTLDSMLTEVNHYSAYFQIEYVEFSIGIIYWLHQYK